MLTEIKCNLKMKLSFSLTLIIKIGKNVIKLVLINKIEKRLYRCNKKNS